MDSFFFLLIVRRYCKLAIKHKDVKYQMFKLALDQYKDFVKKFDNSNNTDKETLKLYINRTFKLLSLLSEEFRLDKPEFQKSVNVLKTADNKRKNHLLKKKFEE